MSMKIYIGNLPYTVTEPELSDLFAPHGTVESVKIITDRYSGKSKGFAFVEMSGRTEGEQAIHELNDLEVKGRKINVSEARPKRDKRNDRGMRSRRTRDY